MTKEQIEGLEAVARHGVSAFLDPMSKADAILRLLEERKRLLEALRRADEDAYDYAEDDTNTIVKAALAFVEEEG